MGETLIGRKGAKYRFADEGQKKAIPRPPLVNASSMPCEPVATNKKRKLFAKLVCRNRLVDAPSSARSAANMKEWLKPR